MSASRRYRSVAAAPSARRTCATTTTCPKWKIPQTYEVFADGELLTCEPADVLPMAQRLFLL